jgi:hypothetical protein
MIHALLTWRSDIQDLAALIDGTKVKPEKKVQRKDSRSGYLLVAPRISRYTRAMKGTDSEQRLNKRATAIDQDG